MSDPQHPEALKVGERYVPELYHGPAPILIVKCTVSGQMVDAHELCEVMNENDKRLDAEDSQPPSTVSSDKAGTALEAILKRALQRILSMCRPADLHIEGCISDVAGKALREYAITKEDAANRHPQGEGGDPWAKLRPFTAINGNVYAGDDSFLCFTHSDDEAQWIACALNGSPPLDVSECARKAAEAIESYVVETVNNNQDPSVYHMANLVQRAFTPPPIQPSKQEKK